MLIKKIKKATIKANNNGLTIDTKIYYSYNIYYDIEVNKEPSGLFTITGSYRENTRFEYKEKRKDVLDKVRDVYIKKGTKFKFNFKKFKFEKINYNYVKGYVEFKGLSGITTWTSNSLLIIENKVKTAYEAI